MTGLERLDRQALPAFLVSRSGPERLRVITCGGEYDAKAGGYQHNLVVGRKAERSAYRAVNRGLQ